MSAALPSSPAEMRAYIVERLVGETGEPERVTEAARGLVEKAIPPIRERLKQGLALDLTVELATVELARMADARPEGLGHAMAVVTAEAASDALVMTMDADAVALVVSALFGGDPGIAVAPIRRALSPTETSVASRLFEELAKAFGEAREGQFAPVLPLPDAVSGGELRKVPLRDGPAVQAVLEISTQAGKGSITLTMPQRLLRKGADAADARRGGPPAQWRQRFSEEVMRSGVELRATMPLARMTLGQIAGLQPGQLIEFDAEAQSQAKLSTRQKTLFVCEFGKLGQNYTVRVRHPFETGQDVMEGLVAAR